MMTPVEKINEMKVLHIEGLRGNSEGGSSVEGLMGAILRSSTALPLLREILKFSKVDLDDLGKELVETKIEK